MNLPLQKVRSEEHVNGKTGDGRTHSRFTAYRPMSYVQLLDGAVLISTAFHRVGSSVGM